VNDHVIFRRSIFAAWTELRFVLLQAFCWLFLMSGLTIKVVAPNLAPTWHTPGNKIPVVAGLFLIYVGTGAWVSGTLYMRWRDMRDEYYEITEDNRLRIVYRTWGKLFLPREAHLSRVDSGEYRKQGWLQYFFNWGDVILQVGWATGPFVMKDVPKPARVFRYIMERKESCARQMPVDALANLDLEGWNE
jgi:hypothetical protein